MKMVLAKMSVRFRKVWLRRAKFESLIKQMKKHMKTKLNLTLMLISKRLLSQWLLLLLMLSLRFL